MKETLKFKISSALKDILGRDLITDDNIAVFELVKNAFDAYATRVDIYFENIYDDNSKIIIKDNGKGMDIADLENKWLFVAYSAKREGTEDDNFDYRDKIYINRHFAGAKGIGRFSCDKLGKYLRLETTKNKKNAKTEILITNWENFEGDLKDEFIDINVQHETKEKTETHGTVLEISGLRNEWDRNKLLKLRDSLAKLINPSRGEDENEFKIFVHVPEENENDKWKDEYYNIVNGEVRNFIFEALELKTTQIITRVSEDRRFITTELKDGGTPIYKIKEENSYKLLGNIEYTIFYLNKSAKLTFARRMGVSTTKYGNIFLYKNGFRIYPFGEPGEDPLKVNARFAQGYRRYLALRSLIGRIEIHGEQPDLRETTSRGDGIIKTKTYHEFEEVFNLTLRRLERYVIDVQRWGFSIEDDLNLDDEEELHRGISEFFIKLAGSIGNILELEYGEKLLEILRKHSQSNAEKVVETLKSVAEESGNEELLEAAKRAENIIGEIRAAKEEAERETHVIKQNRDKLEEQLGLKIQENLLLKEATNEDTIEILSIEHHINQTTYRIGKHLKALTENIKSGGTQMSQLSLINLISLENRKVASLVNYVRKATFDTMSASFKGDLINYIAEYIENVYKEDRIRIVNKQLIDVDIEYDPKDKLIMDFVPLEVNIILDNLLDNSFKALATKAWVKLRLLNSKTVELLYRDDGSGIKDEYLQYIFDFGFTTTQGGTGIGLFHIKELVEKSYRGIIEVNNKIKPGIEFKLTFKVK